MSDQNTKITCPSCSLSFVPPEGLERCFCPGCGTPIALRTAAPQQQPAPTQAPVQPSYQTVSLHDQATGRGLFVATLPTNWRVTSTNLKQTNSTSRPFIPSVSLKADTSAVIDLNNGEAGQRNSAGMKRLMATYGAAISAVDRTNYAEMPDPRALSDNLISTIIQKAGAHDLKLVTQLASPYLPQRQKEAWALFQQAAKASGGALIKDPFAAEVIRIYEFTFDDGEVWRYACYQRLVAVKDASGVGDGPLGMSPGLGLLGGLLTANKKAKATEKSLENAKSTNGWSIPDFGSYVKDGTIIWNVLTCATLRAKKPEFDAAFKQAFLPLIATVQLHNDLFSLMMAASQQQAAATQAATNQQVANMNAQFQAQQAAMRQVQAAHDAQMASWQAASDAHHAAFRERTNAQFNTTSGSERFADAMRGVNTFVTTDGRHVELSTSADRAYQNQAGDVIGGSGGFDPGANWTEIPLA